MSTYSRRIHAWLNEQINEQRGTILPVVAVMLAVLVSMAALAVDVGYLFVVRAELQNAADAGALAGAAELYNDEGTFVSEKANQAAFDLAAANRSGSMPVAVKSVERGYYSFITGRFEARLDADPTLINAVRVVTERTDIPSFFARVFGYQSFVLQAEAVAYRRFAGNQESDTTEQPGARIPVLVQ